MSITGTFINLKNMSITGIFIKSQEYVYYRDIYNISRKCQLQGDL